MSNGGAPRTAAQNEGLLSYADAGVLREYCHPGDPICCPNSENKQMSQHLSYFDQYGDEAAAWVIDLANKATQEDRTSGARAILHQTISHPVANAFMLLFVLFLL
jgi:acetylxylan esterase